MEHKTITYLGIGASVVGTLAAILLWQREKTLAQQVTASNTDTASQLQSSLYPLFQSAALPSAAASDSGSTVSTSDISSAITSALSGVIATIQSGQSAATTQTAAQTAAAQQISIASLGASLDSQLLGIAGYKNAGALTASFAVSPDGTVNFTAARGNPTNNKPTQAELNSGTYNPFLFTLPSIGPNGSIAGAPATTIINTAIQTPVNTSKSINANGSFLINPRA